MPAVVADPIQETVLCLHLAGRSDAEIETVVRRHLPRYAAAWVGGSTVYLFIPRVDGGFDMVSEVERFVALVASGETSHAYGLAAAAGADISLLSVANITALEASGTIRRLA